MYLIKNHTKMDPMIMLVLMLLKLFNFGHCQRPLNNATFIGLNSTGVINVSQMQPETRNPFSISPPQPGSEKLEILRTHHPDPHQPGGGGGGGGAGGRGGRGRKKPTSSIHALNKLNMENKGATNAYSPNSSIQKWKGSLGDEPKKTDLIKQLANRFKNDVS